MGMGGGVRVQKCFGKNGSALREVNGKDEKGQVLEDLLGFRGSMGFMIWGDFWKGRKPPFIEEKSRMEWLKYQGSDVFIHIERTSFEIWQHSSVSKTSSPGSWLASYVRKLRESFGLPHCSVTSNFAIRSGMLPTR
jgi:hypothetical protein